ncbi:hypothetical protein [Haloarcula laminariae]|uniref:hypothetical protein n=1 Tax=Haloarcula laminariae TaxID=2961577 RepID=UPI002406BE6C|nr:hypothetical protein [Halomicroarcula sp. FL173]
MAANKDDVGDPPMNLLEQLLEQARQKYIEVNDEEPPDEFLEEAEDLILRELAEDSRDAHRDIYDALADE